MGTCNGTIGRTYERTHPWLTFTVDLKQAPPKLWIDLGECKSKCEHIAGVPLKPGVGAKLHTVYLAKGALATTAIEGNTLSEEEVQKHLEGKLKLSPSRQYLAREIDNIVDACNNMLRDIMQRTPLRLDPDRAKELNKLVLRNLQLEDGVVPGEIRGHDVGVARYKGAPPEDCEYLLGRLLDWLNSDVFRPREGMSIVFAIIKAVMAHLYFAWIHPFGDGNGRTARLLEFQILIESGVPAPAAHLLSNHYNQTRTQYYRELDQSSKSAQGALSFICYAVEGFRDGLRSQLMEIGKHQWLVSWENYVHGKFKDKKGETSNRRRHLVLDLSLVDEFVAVSNVREISTRMAAAYAKKTNKTLNRDVNALVKLGLVEKKTGAIRALKEKILAFLPIIAEGPEARAVM